MTANQRTVHVPEIRFCDGRRYFIASDSVAEFLLHPVFLKYVLACTMVYGLLDRGSVDTGGLQGFQIAVLWSVIAIAAMVYYAVALNILRFLWLRGLIRMLYTPLLNLPLFLVTTTTTFLMVRLMTGTVTTDPDVWMAEMARDMMVFLLMDFFFGNYVAPFHPSLRQDPPVRVHGAPAFESEIRPIAANLAPPMPEDPGVPAPHAAILPNPPTDAAEAVDDDATAAPEPARETDTVLRVGREAIAVGSIIFVKSEDHYLRIVTQDRRLMIRGRLSEALPQLGVDLGVQVNRSTWVAFGAIASTFEDDKGTLSLKLTTGETERVATSRRIAFLTVARQKRLID